MTTILEVTGMTCMHCVRTVTQALQRVAGVDQVEVSLERQQALVTGKADMQAMIAAVKAQGYGARAR
jgi:copper chaperone CopZ